MAIMVCQTIPQTLLVEGLTFTDDVLIEWTCPNRDALPTSWKKRVEVCNDPIQGSFQFRSQGRLP